MNEKKKTVPNSGTKYCVFKPCSCAYKRAAANGKKSEKMSTDSAAEKKDKNGNIPKRIRKYWILYVMILGGMLYFIIFHYVPLYGLLLAFKDFKYRLGIFGSPWVGWKNFHRLFASSAFQTAFRNTIIISIGKIVTGFPAPLILSLLINELHSLKFKKVTQSVLYLPYFLSWVIVAGICFNMFSTTNGAIPKLVASMGGKMPELLSEPSTFRGFLYITDIWKGMGWGTILYMAAISGIDPTLYEAAIMDGCNRFKQAIYITLPSIRFTIVTLLILSVGNVMNAGFDQIFNLYSNRVYGVADIIDTYVYRIGVINADYGISTVAGLTKSIINCILLFTANYFAGKLTDESFL